MSKQDKTGPTPGPWEHVKAEYLSHDAPGFEQMLSPGGILGGTPDDPHWVVEGEIEYAPDAHVLAAAWDMLAELQRLFARHGYQSTADVIAKATGAQE